MDKKDKEGEAAGERGQGWRRAKKELPGELRGDITVNPGIPHLLWSEEMSRVW